MGYAEHIKDLLRPMRLYDLDTGVGADELCALGEQMDELYTALTEAEREATVPTAIARGLSGWEEALPFYPCYRSMEDRRRAIMSLLSMDGASFTPSALNATLAGCGIMAEAEETEERTRVRVSFPKNRGMPTDLAELSERIEAILPCQLEAEYYIILISWQELETWLPTWQAIEDGEYTWDALERYGGEE